MKTLSETKLVICTSVFLAVFITVFYCMNNVFTISARILRAEDLNDLKPYPELNVFPKLLQAIKSDPEKERLTISRITIKSHIAHTARNILRELTNCFHVFGLN